jgi:hypothetical protein
MSRLPLLFAVWSLACAAPAGPVPPTATPPDLVAARADVDSVLTTLHRTASTGSWDQYFALYTPDAVFLGTDPGERWDLAAFRGYAAGSKGWTYVPTERHVFVATDGQTAWFDERLQNANYGETRGSGVLVKGAQGWRLAQYNLTLPIPNELAGDVVARIKASASTSAP